MTTTRYRLSSPQLNNSNTLSLLLIAPLLLLKALALPNLHSSSSPHSLSRTTPSYSFALMNECPDSTILFRYTQLPSSGPQPPSPPPHLRQTKSPEFHGRNISLSSGKSSWQSLTSPLFAYHLYRDEVLVNSGTIQLSSPHHNVVGYFYSASHGTCHFFHYLPQLPSVSLPTSLLFLINGDPFDKDLYLNEKYFGKIPANYSRVAHASEKFSTAIDAPGYLPIFFDEPITFQKFQELKFCTFKTPERVCSLWNFPKTVLIPSGSGLIIYHSQSLSSQGASPPSNHQAPVAHISMAATGATSNVIPCQNIPENLSDDLIESFFLDRGDVLSVMSLLYRAVVIGCFLLSGCLSYLFFSLLSSCLTSAPIVVQPKVILNQKLEKRSEKEEMILWRKPATRESKEKAVEEDLVEKDLEMKTD